MDKLWLRIEDKDALVTSLGDDANHLRTHHHKVLDDLARDLRFTLAQNKRWKEAYGDDAPMYVQNSHFVMDRCGKVLAAGDEAHCLHYMQAGRVLVIRAEMLEARG